MKFEELPRRKIRYWLFRFRTEDDGGTSSDDAPVGLKEKFEGLEWFQGWHNFSVVWDIHEEDFFRIVPLAESIDDQWNKVLERVTIELKPDVKFTDKLDQNNKKISKKKAKKKSKKKTKKDSK